MSRVTVNEQYLQDTADAIREKTGSSDTYKPSQFASAIADISGGSGDFEVVTVSIINQTNGWRVFYAPTIYEYDNNYTLSSISIRAGTTISADIILHNGGAICQSDQSGRFMIYGNALEEEYVSQGSIVRSGNIYIYDNDD